MLQARPEALKTSLIAGVGGGLLNALLRTVRTELIAGAEVDRDLLRSDTGCVLVLWHGRLLPAAFHYRDHGFGTLISRNRDGDYISRVVDRWGYRIVRGSSSRGGTAALRQIVAMLEEGRPVALTPDGPRGPRQKMKLGPLQAARMAGVPVVPGAAGAARAAYFGRWDRFLVPAPFTWSPVALGEPLSIPRDATDDDLKEYAAHLEVRLNEMTELTDEAARGSRR